MPGDSRVMVDTYGPVSMSLDEGGSLPENVLAKVRGPFFFPDGVSRNKRFYPRELWESTLSRPDIQEKLKNKTMFGTVFHPEVEPPIENYSHIVTDLYIDPNNPNVGIGEALIVNTERGRALAMFMKMGSRWCVSSRAVGSFVPGKTTPDGIPIVDPDTFNLITFDFTPDPGFVEAHPKIVEAYLGGSPEVDYMENKRGSHDIVESLVAEKRSLQSRLDEALAANEAYTAIGTPEQIKEALMRASNSVDQLRSYQREGSVKEFRRLKDRCSNLKEQLDIYRRLGSPRSIRKLFKVTEELSRRLSKYASLGTVKEIREVFEKSTYMTDALAAYRKLGTPENIMKVFEEAKRLVKLVEQYRKFGTIREIQEAVDATRRLIKEFKVYKKFGSPRMIQETYNKMVKFMDHHRRTEINHKIPYLASEFGVPEEYVKIMIETVGPNEKKVRDSLLRLSEAHRARIDLFSLSSEPVKTRPVSESISTIESIGRNL